MRADGEQDPAALTCAFLLPEQLGMGVCGSVGSRRGYLLLHLLCIVTHGLLLPRLLLLLGLLLRFKEIHGGCLQVVTYYVSSTWVWQRCNSPGCAAVADALEVPDKWDSHSGTAGLQAKTEKGCA